MRHFILWFAIFLCIFSDCYVSAYNDEQFLPKDNYYESDVIHVTEEELDKIIQKHTPERKVEQEKRKSVPRSNNPYIKYKNGEHPIQDSTFDFNTVHIPFTPPTPKKETTIPTEPVIEQSITPPVIPEPVEQEEQEEQDFTESVVPPFSNNYIPEKDFLVIKALEAFRKWSTVTRHEYPYVTERTEPIYDDIAYNQTKTYQNPTRNTYSYNSDDTVALIGLIVLLVLILFSFSCAYANREEKKAPKNNDYIGLKSRKFDKTFEVIFSQFKTEISRKLPYSIKAGSLEERIFLAECIFCIVINAMMYAGIKYNKQIADNKKLAFGYLAAEQVIQIFDKAQFSKRLLKAYFIRVYEYSTQIEKFTETLSNNNIEFDIDQHLENFFVASIGNILKQSYTNSRYISSERKPLHNMDGNVVYEAKPNIKSISRNTNWIIFNAVKQYAKELRKV